MLDIPLNAKQITSWELTKQSNALRDNGRFYIEVYMYVFIYIYIRLYIHVHACLVVEPGDADRPSLCDWFS